jgi:hypothetical protein
MDSGAEPGAEKCIEKITIRDIIPSKPRSNFKLKEISLGEEDEQLLNELADAVVAAANSMISLKDKDTQILPGGCKIEKDAFVTVVKKYYADLSPPQNESTGQRGGFNRRQFLLAIVGICASLLFCYISYLQFRNLSRVFEAPTIQTQSKALVALQPTESTDLQNSLTTYIDSVKHVDTSVVETREASFLQYALEAMTMNVNQITEERDLVATGIPIVISMANDIKTNVVKACTPQTNIADPGSTTGNFLNFVSASLSWFNSNTITQRLGCSASVTESTIRFYISALNTNAVNVVNNFIISGRLFYASIILLFLSLRSTTMPPAGGSKRKQTKKRSKKSKKTRRTRKTNFRTKNSRSGRKK